LLTSRRDGNARDCRPPRPDFHFRLPVGDRAAFDRYLPAGAADVAAGTRCRRSADAVYAIGFFIGFGAGQLVLGPLADRFGRKGPPLAGLALYSVASVACALAGSMHSIVLWRLAQACGGAAVPTAVQAMVRDLYDRNQSARVLSLNMMVTASAPIVAPLIGGQVLLWFDWRAIFWVLVAFGLVSLLAALTLPETLTPERRNAAHPLAMVLGYFEFLHSRRYLGYLACSTFYFCCLFAFIAGSPFVYIEYFGISPQHYGFLFGVNMLGMVAMSTVNGRIVVQRGADRLLRLALFAGAGASLVLLATGLSGFGGVVGIAAPLFVVLALLTVVASNAISGALSVFPNRAGAAAALAGALQFGAAALISAAVGFFANGTPRPMIVIICLGAIAALLANLLLLRTARA